MTDASFIGIAREAEQLYVVFKDDSGKVISVSSDALVNAQGVDSAAASAALQQVMAGGYGMKMPEIANIAYLQNFSGMQLELALLQIESWADIIADEDKLKKLTAPTGAASMPPDRAASAANQAAIEEQIRTMAGLPPKTSDDELKAASDALKQEIQQTATKAKKGFGALWDGIKQGWKGGPS